MPILPLLYRFTSIHSKLNDLNDISMNLLGPPCGPSTALLVVTLELVQRDAALVRSVCLVRLVRYVRCLHFGQHHDHSHHTTIQRSYDGHTTVIRRSYDGHTIILCLALTSSAISE